MCASHNIPSTSKREGKKDRTRCQTTKKEADEGNLIPLRQYQRALKGSRKQDRNYTLNKLDDAKTKTPLERQQRWTEWIGQQFSVPTEKEIPKTCISHRKYGQT